MSPEEKLVLTSNYDFNELKTQQFPNVIEKQVLLQISKHNHISVAVLLQKLSVVSKAINKPIDKDSLLGIIDKYIEKGIINKHMVNLEKEKSIYNSGMNLRGDVM